ncbi:hypothetical protein [Symmachiella macrocystis]|uniref:hypothetical protein n=1 Tax=Symmachiella macrocystis TaxID=2527985 RepID=UPI0018D28325|nr:hypothetical protein [Symmachiella macrocystis]
MLTIIHHQCFLKPPDVPIPQHFTKLPNGKNEDNDFMHSLLLVVMREKEQSGRSHG